MPRPISISYMAWVHEQIVAHLYRGELSRSDTWRTRLDTTTNWALTTAAAVVSFTFASPQSPAAVVIVGGILVLTFLFLEARRYRYYDLWIRRLRLIEDGFIAPMLRDDTPDPDALRELAELMTRPRLTISLWDAAALRFRRTYAPIFAVLNAAWLFKVYEHPTPARSLAEVLERARIGAIPGTAVFIVGGVVAAIGIIGFVVSMRRPLPSGELRPRPRGKRPVSAVFGQRAETSR
jgi:uncharacterized membrane protein